MKTDSRQPSEGDQLRNQEGEIVGSHDEVPTTRARAAELDAELRTEAEAQVDAVRAAMARRIDNDFRYHPPASPEQLEAYTVIREYGRQMAHRLNDLVPPGRELATALTKLEAVVMYANAGIARSGRGKS